MSILFPTIQILTCPYSSVSSYKFTQGVSTNVLGTFLELSWYQKDTNRESATYPLPLPCDQSVFFFNCLHYITFLSQFLVCSVFHPGHDCHVSFPCSCGDPRRGSVLSNFQSDFMCFSIKPHNVLRDWQRLLCPFSIWRKQWKNRKHREAVERRNNHNLRRTTGVSSQGTDFRGTPI